jgi:hypothetical protein
MWIGSDKLSGPNRFASRAECERIVEARGLQHFRALQWADERLYVEHCGYLSASRPVLRRDMRCAVAGSSAIMAWARSRL